MSTSTTTDVAPGVSGREEPGEIDPAPPRRSGRRFVGGRPDDPRWARPVLLLLLAVSALTYLWDLGASGYANSFYAAAVQAGTQSWKAWLFGALDAPGVITVDKPPASLWVMALSGRIFGFSSWSMLVPDALMGVASVALVYATVRRWSGARTALAAAALLAFTPVAVLMFRFNNPDAMLVLVMVAAAYTTTRAVDAAGRRAGTWWLVAAGALVGLGFLTKQLQVMLVVPALGLVYLVVAPTRLRRRLLDLAASVAALVVSAGWYVLLVDLWPASSRPYIGGSTDNSLLELALGYNGLGRILGGSGNGGGGGRRGAAGGAAGGAAPSGGAGGGAAGAAGGPPAGLPGGAGGGPGGGGPGGGGFGGGGFGGSPSPIRMFTSEFSAQASWLLPAALVVLVAGLWFTRRAPRTDRTRGLLVLGGTWMVVHAIVFSFMSGTIHPYYTVAMAPGIAMTAAAGASIAWRHRARLAARLVLAVSVLGTGIWSAVILTQQSLAVLGWVLAAVSLVGAVALLVPALTVRRLRAVGITAVVVAVLGALGGSTALAAVTAVTPHQGSIVSAGTSSGGGPGGGPGGGGGPGNAGFTAADRSGRATGDRRGGGGGGMEGETPSAALVTLLQQAGTRWAAATTGANAAAPLELASGVPVISIGGFMGSDPAPTLAQFQEYVATGQVHYYVEGGGPGGGGGFPGAADRTGDRAVGFGGGRENGSSSEIGAWVAAHFTPTDVGGRTVYDLTKPHA